MSHPDHDNRLYRKVIAVIAEKIRSEISPADISEVMEQVDKLLDNSVSTEGYVVRASATGDNYIDLSKIDFGGVEGKVREGQKTDRGAEAPRADRS